MEQTHSSTDMAQNPMLAVRADKLRPCDCKDAIDTSKLEEQGIEHNLVLL